MHSRRSLYPVTQVVSNLLACWLSKFPSILSVILPRNFVSFWRILDQDTSITNGPYGISKNLQHFVKDFDCKLNEWRWKGVAITLVCSALIFVEISMCLSIMFPAPLYVWPQESSKRWENLNKISLIALKMVSLYILQSQKS